MPGDEPLTRHLTVTEHRQILNEAPAYRLYVNVTRGIFLRPPVNWAFLACRSIEIWDTDSESEQVLDEGWLERLFKLRPPR
jgi:hypothetical protein